MLMIIAFLITLILIAWTMVEIVSPHQALKVYKKLGVFIESEEFMLKLIRIDGLISWLIFTILAAYLWGKISFWS